MDSTKMKTNSTEFQITSSEWIHIQRKQLTDGTEAGVSITLYDTELDVSKHLGTYYAGKWVCTNPFNKELLFSLLKKFPRIGREFKNVANCYLNASTEFQMTWFCFKRRFILKIKKLQHKFIL